MQEFKLKAKKREKTGKKFNNELRKQGKIPANIYGGTEGNIMIEVEEKDLKKLLYTDKVYFVNIELDGQTIQCIKKEEQFHPVTDKVLHIDFLRTFEDKKVKLYVPVHLTGFAKGVKSGGHLFQMKRYLRVEGLPSNIPDFLEVDVTDLGLGKSLKINELKFDNLTILEPESDIIAIVKLTRAAMSQAEASEEEASEEAKEE